MKKQSFIKFLHKPVHPVISTIAINGVVLLIGASPFIAHALSRFDFSFTTPPKITTVHVTPNPNITAVPHVSTSTLTPSFAPTPTLAPGQKAIYTFYIQATSHTTDHSELVLTPSDTGKMFTADIGTLIILYFGMGIFHISHSSTHDIFEASGSKSNPIHLPLNSIGAFNIIRSGYGKITVIETE